MKHFYEKIISIVMMLTVSINLHGSIVKTELSGLQNGDAAVLTISSENYISSIAASENGSYEFADVPIGLHSVKVEVTGYNLPKTQLVRVNNDGSVDPQISIKLVVTKMDENPDAWHHVWESDESIGGYTTTSYINTRPEVEFLGKKVTPSDVPSMAILMEQYKIILVDEELPWTQEHAYRLLETMKTLPSNYDSKTLSKFILTDTKLTDDLSIENNGEGNTVRISQDAFAYANPFLVNLDGVRGKFFSKRLHHALTKFVTDFGSDKNAVNNILSERFGVSIEIPDYSALTAHTTGEDAGSFQEFYPSELVAIINMFEELPEGFHKTPNLKYLARRADGHLHPIYDGAAAVSWCMENGYIEFINAPHMNITSFGGNNERFDTQRLILHEKTHFLWAFSFSDEIKSQWAEIGGWYKDPNAGDDPNSGWSTTKTTEFVSAYAHAHNPNEDMAESVAFYLKDPEELMSRSIAKYEFIRDRIMHGTRYISSIPDHLTFEVLNLFPDYDYPGKIKKVEISVEGKPEEDKELTFDIYLNHLEGYNDGASSAFTRIFSPTFIDDEGNLNGTYIDLGFDSVNEDPWHLRGTYTISKYSKSGYWIPGDINVNDLAGNTRYEGRNDCISNIYINNSLEDLIVPKYEKESLRYEISDVKIGDHHEQILSVKFNAYDNINVSNVYGGLYTGVDSNHMPGWNTIVDKENKTIEIQYRIRDYFYSTDYYIAHLSITDEGGISKDIRFSEDPSHEPIKKIHIETPNPDYKDAELDLNRIYVYAQPSHPEAPDGETIVKTTFYAKDNIAGLAIYSITLRDPQGSMHFYWGDATPTDEEGYFRGDPTIWTKYEQTLILPQGSAPGIWGIGEITLRDHAYNDFTYNFVETLIFEPDDSEDGWELFADFDEQKMLNITFANNASAAYGFTYRIINEETGEEISGNSRVTKTRSGEEQNIILDTCVVDVSSMSDGNLLVIATVKDDEGNVVTVKSTKILKESSSGIKTMNTDNSNLMIAVHNGHIEIKGLDEEKIVDIYTLNGITVFSGSVKECESHQLESGIYILKVNEKVAKIHIK